MTRTYNPLPAWGPAAFAAAVLFLGYVAGPAAGRYLFTRAMRGNA